MIDVYRKKTENLEVEFQEVKWGLMSFTIKLGDQTFETNFSDVFDPLQNFKAWLEAISIGVPQCSFSYDPEGDEIKFNYERISYDIEIFTVSYNYDDNDFFLSGKIERKQLVKEFYSKFIEFTDSEKFTRHFWEKITYSERLTELLRMDYEIIIDKLSKLGRKQLSDWLDLAGLQSRWNETLTEEGEKELAVLLKKRLANAESTYFPEMDEKKGCQLIPRDFGNWDITERKEFLKELLGWSCSSQYGTKVKSFYSVIIEEYIEYRC